MDILQYPFDPLVILKKKKSIRKELLLNSNLIKKKLQFFLVLQSEISRIFWNCFC